jgi:hypothetical protein
MIDAQNLSQLLASEERFYALVDEGGPVRAGWGKVLLSGADSLFFKKFHSPRLKSPSVWKDFLDSTSWTLAEQGEFSRAGLASSAPAPFPAAPLEEDREAWMILCKKAGDAIAREVTKKIVPARQVSFALKPGEHKAILAALPSRLFGPAMENTFRFLV